MDRDLAVTVRVSRRSVVEALVAETGLDWDTVMYHIDAYVRDEASEIVESALRFETGEAEAFADYVKRQTAPVGEAAR